MQILTLGPPYKESPHYASPHNATPHYASLCMHADHENTAVYNMLVITFHPLTKNLPTMHLLTMHLPRIHLFTMHPS